jgi:hypothetical protein
MTSPETPPLQPDPAAPRSRGVWIAPGLYIAGAVATAVLANYPGWGRDGEVSNSVATFLGPYVFLADAIISTHPVLNGTLFLLTSLVILLLLPTVASRNGYLRVVLGTIAVGFWIFCGLFQIWLTKPLGWQ